MLGCWLILRSAGCGAPAGEARGAGPARLWAACRAWRARRGCAGRTSWSTTCRPPSSREPPPSRRHRPSCCATERPISAPPLASSCRLSRAVTPGWWVGSRPATTWSSTTPTATWACKWSVGEQSSHGSEQRATPSLRLPARPQRPESFRGYHFVSIATDSPPKRGGPAGESKDLAIADALYSRQLVSSQRTSVDFCRRK